MKKSILNFLVIISFFLLFSCSSKKNTEQINNQNSIIFSCKLTEPTSVYELLDIKKNNVTYPLELESDEYKFNYITELPEDTSVRFYPDKLYYSKENLEYYIYISVKKVKGWIPIQKFVLPDDFLDNLFEVLPKYKDSYTEEQLEVFNYFIYRQVDSIDQDYFSSLIEKYYTNNKIKFISKDISLIDSLLFHVKENPEAKTNPLSYQIKYTESTYFFEVIEDYQSCTSLLEVLLNFPSEALNNTPLIDAIESNNYSAVEFLLSKNCDVKHTNFALKSAFDYADKSENKKIQQLILNSSLDVYEQILQNLTKDIDVNVSPDLSLTTETSPGISFTITKQLNLVEQATAIRKTKLYHFDNSVTTIPPGEEVDIIKATDDKYIKIQKERGIFKYYLAKYNEKYGIICGEDFANKDFFRLDGEFYMTQEFEYGHADANIDVYRFSSQTNEVQKITFHNYNIYYNDNSYFENDAPAVHEDERMVITPIKNLKINDENYTLISIEIFNKVNYNLLEKHILYYVSEDDHAFMAYDFDIEQPGYIHLLTDYYINLEDIQLSDDNVTLKIKFYEGCDNQIKQERYITLSTSPDNPLQFIKTCDDTGNEVFCFELYQYLDIEMAI